MRRVIVHRYVYGYSMRCIKFTDGGGVVVVVVVVGWWWWW